MYLNIRLHTKYPSMPSMSLISKKLMAWPDEVL